MLVSFCLSFYFQGQEEKKPTKNPQKNRKTMENKANEREVIVGDGERLPEVEGREA